MAIIRGISSHGASVIFKLSICGLFHPRGLSAAKLYPVQFHDHTRPDRIMSGRDLMQKGLSVDLSVPISSELIFLREQKN